MRMQYGRSYGGTDDSLASFRNFVRVKYSYTYESKDK